MTQKADRRRTDRRRDYVSLAEYTVPELRKALLTGAILLVVLIAFFYMVREVVVAVIAGIVVGAYLIPYRRWLARFLGHPRLTAVISILTVLVPLLVIGTYSWLEISQAAAYLDAHSDEVVRGLSRGLERIPLAHRVNLERQIPGWVDAAASSSATLAGELRETIDIIIIGFAVFVFTSFYVLTDHERIRGYVRERIPGRYRDLTDPIAEHIRSVVYGVMYGTFLTQIIKAAVVLAMNLIWDVPLAIVLAIASFFIGLLPVVGSWTVYTPVAIYLMLWRGDVVGGVIMLVVGFVVNTMFMSMYMRPRLAAEKSEVLNFYWMFIALVSGVYTFGLMGIVIGPVLIAVLKAILESLTSTRPKLAAARVRPATQE